MRIVGYPKEFYHVARLHRRPLSPKAQERLHWLIIWQRLQQRGISGQEASRILGVSRASLYRWQKRLRLDGLRGLEEKSRKPKRRRQRNWSPELVQAILALREQYPRWGKEKLIILLYKQGFRTSSSTVGRILHSLKSRHLLIETPSSYDKTRPRRPKRPYARRKPREYAPNRPGDLVQIDTLDVRPLPGVILKHFTARDVVSRWDVIEVHRRATASQAVHFLDTLIQRAPFPIRAVQVDGGSEFQAAFEAACQQRHIQLFVLPPHSPKLNGHVERAHRTHQEEFYEVYLDDLRLEPLNAALQAWEKTYNYIRPHQSLDGLTPAEYIQKHFPELKPPLSHMY